MRVIGIGHRARQGKDTIARYLLQEYYHRYQGYAAIYPIATALRGWVRLQGLMTNKDPAVLVAAGDLLRRRDPNVLTEAVAWQLLDEQPEFAIIPDVRLPCDVALIHRFQGYLVQVTRVQVGSGAPWISPDRDATHPTEMALDTCEAWNERLVFLDGEYPAPHQAAARDLLETMFP